MRAAVAVSLVVGAAVLWELRLGVQEHIERHQYYGIARAYCDEVGKPLLTIGMQRWSGNPPDGDYVIDTDPAVMSVPGGIMGSVTEIPFPDKHFGVAYNSHVLEHLDTPEDIELAIVECRRVADYAFLLTPSPNSLYANLFCPSHKFRLWYDKENNKILVKPSTWQTGWGVDYPSVSQAMVTYDPLPLPAVVAL